MSGFRSRTSGGERVRVRVRVPFDGVRVERGLCPGSVSGTNPDIQPTRRVGMSGFSCPGFTMTTLRLRLCSVCRSPILDGRGARCDECRRAWNRQYNANRPELHRVYQSPEWRRLSASVRASARRCHWCLRPLGGGKRFIADHVIPLDQRPDLALDPGNVVASCIGCNTRRGRNARLPELLAVAS